MSDSTFLLLLLTAIAWIWWDSRATAELALEAVRRRCDWAGVVLLNDTVAWKQMRLRRNRNGRITFERTYRFEFSADLQVRHQGEVVMLGRQMQSILMDPYRDG